MPGPFAQLDPSMEGMTDDPSKAIYDQLRRSMYDPAMLAALAGMVGMARSSGGQPITSGFAKIPQVLSERERGIQEMQDLTRKVARRELEREFGRAVTDEEVERYRTDEALQDAVSYRRAQRMQQQSPTMQEYQRAIQPGQRVHQWPGIAGGTGWSGPASAGRTIPSAGWTGQGQAVDLSDVDPTQLRKLLEDLGGSMR